MTAPRSRHLSQFNTTTQLNDNPSYLLHHWSFHCGMQNTDYPSTPPCAEAVDRRCLKKTVPGERISGDGSAGVGAKAADWLRWKMPIKADKTPQGPAVGMVSSPANEKLADLFCPAHDWIPQSQFGVWRWRCKGKWHSMGDF